MTQAQWLFEFNALREKEKEQVDQATALLKSFKYLMIKLLGLDIFADLENLGLENKEEFDLDGIKFIPFSLIAGRPEMIKAAVEKFTEAEQAKVALQDDEFEQLSKAIADGDIGDMDPIIAPVKIDPKRQWNSEENRRQLAALGVKMVDKINDPGLHIKVDHEEATRKRTAQALEQAQIKREMEQHLEDEKKGFKERKLTFFDGPEDTE